MQIVLLALIAGALVGLAVLAFFRPTFPIVYVFSAYAIKHLFAAHSAVAVQYHQGFIAFGGVLSLIALYSVLRRNNFVFPRMNKTQKLAIALYGWSLLSCVWSIYPEGAYDRWLDLFPHVGLALVLLPLLARRFEDFRFVHLATIGWGSLVLVALWLTGEFEGRYIQIQTRAASTGEGRINSPLGLARYAGIVLIALHFCEFKGQYKRIYWSKWVFMAVCAYLLAKSGCRGEFILAVASIVIVTVCMVLVKGVQTKQVFMVFAVTFSVMTAFLVLESVTSLQGRWQLERIVEDWDVRWALASRVLSVWWSEPVYWLIGLGTSASYSPRILGIYCHAVPAEVLAELGLIGFSIYCCVAFTGFLGTFKGGKELLMSNGRESVWAFWAAISIFLWGLTFKTSALLGSQEAFAALSLSACLGQLTSVRSLGHLHGEK